MPPDPKRAASIVLRQHTLPMRILRSQQAAIRRRLIGIKPHRPAHAKNGGTGSPTMSELALALLLAALVVPPTGQPAAAPHATPVQASSARDKAATGRGADKPLPTAQSDRAKGTTHDASASASTIAKR
jgi:hypothetical protein